MPAPLSHGEQELLKYRRFCEKFLDNGNGRPWSLKGREYVLDEIWRPMLGYRTVASPGAEVDELCPACREQFWAIEVDHRMTAAPGHRAPCEGLRRVPVITTLLSIPRRNAKSHSILSFLAARIFLKSNQRWAFMASAEDQAEEILETKIVRPLSRNPESTPAVDWDIRPWFKVEGSKLIVPSQNSWIEVLPSSAGSITGRGNTGVAIDECRDVDALAAAAIIPTIWDCDGWECPRCMKQWDAHDSPPACPTDGSPLERWNGRVVLASSMGRVTDNDDKDWFANTVKARLARPKPTAHVFYTDKIINPSVSIEIVDASVDVFSDVPGMSDYMAIESSNQPTRPGDSYMTADDVKAILDRNLEDVCGSTRHAVLFLDTSDTTDLTTLAVIVDDARENEAAFWRDALGHIKVWEPQNPQQCPGGVIVESEIEAYLERVFGLYPKLRRAQVDTRGRPWAFAMVNRIRKTAWGKRLEHYMGKQEDDDAGYQALHDLVLQKRFRMPRPKKDEGAKLFPGMDPHARLMRELPALRKVTRPGARGGFGVVDPNANARGRNKNKKGLHRDIAAGVAGAAALAQEEHVKLATSNDSSTIATRANSGAVNSAFRTIASKPGRKW